MFCHNRQNPVQSLTVNCLKIHICPEITFESIISYRDLAWKLCCRERFQLSKERSSLLPKSSVGELWSSACGPLIYCCTGCSSEHEHSSQAGWEGIVSPQQHCSPLAERWNVHCNQNWNASAIHTGVQAAFPSPSQHPVSQGTIQLFQHHLLSLGSTKAMPPFTTAVTQSCPGWAEIKWHNQPQPPGGKVFSCLEAIPLFPALSVSHPLI